MSNKKKQSGKENRKISVEKLKKLSTWRLTTASGEEIKQRRTMRFWFSCVMLILFAVTCGFTAAVFYIINGILAFYGVYMDTAVLIGAVALAILLWQILAMAIGEPIFLASPLAVAARFFALFAERTERVRVSSPSNNFAIPRF